mmetsp:Transcript_124057/g.312361  ORF Transcript_124057/g.312361 Transcript_124057/m.312361 type:complete len:374 (+) Transcript_124057:59-1180(+)
MLSEGVLNGDSKTQLNQFCQKYCKKVISKADVIYESMKIGDQYQTTLTLACIGGAQFAGEPAVNQKQAEQNVAKIALEHYAEEVASLPVTVSKNNKKRKASASVSVDAGTIAVADPSMNNRCLLNTALMKILKRPVTKEDVNKSNTQTALGFQCTIAIPGLPAEWAGLAWAGEAASNLKDAEESAATYTLEALRQDPTFAELIDSAPAAKKAKTGNGKGAGPGGQQTMLALPSGELSGASPGGCNWGKGGGWDKGGGWAKGCGWATGGWGKGCSWGKGGCKGKGGGKAPGPKPREEVSEIPILGKVIDWKGKYGWIQPNDPVDHPSAKKNGGKIFLHSTDWQQSDSQPEVEQVVQFTLYQDPSGLGAENVVAF